MRVLIPLPKLDFDPSEVAVSWSVLRAAGIEVSFATPDGSQAAGDPIMIGGLGLTVFGPLLRARAGARADYARLLRDPTFSAPSTYDALSAANYDGLLLPGGHRARGMRAYLESATLQRFVVEFFATDKPVAAICHGVLLAARSISPTGRSVLHGRKTTALTWALERSAWRIGRIARFWDPSYYRTYEERSGDPPGYMSVQAEVTRALASPDDFLDVPRNAPDYALKTNGIARDGATDARPAWVVLDGTYVSARWPGDVHTFALTFAEMLASRRPSVAPP
ncbi:MAG TPA: type 1 glutamine amidotransferase domain-containing protein [Candidatus Elarobacter sp.]|jgi:putative intracellular protease/amidase|nr:type 1 glutamine amidotransferase domain-containing protein [Candidatus Elarobacter sp.]